MELNTCSTVAEEMVGLLLAHGADPGAVCGAAGVRHISSSTASSTVPAFMDGSAADSEEIDSAQSSSSTTTPTTMGDGDVDGGGSGSGNNGDGRQQQRRRRSIVGVERLNGVAVTPMTLAAALGRHQLLGLLTAAWVDQTDAQPLLLRSP